MTTTQALPSHSSFASNLLNDQSIHNFASTKPSAENEAITKSVSHRTTRNSSATKTQLKAHDQQDHLTRQEVALQSRESITKSEKNVHATSSDNSMQARSDILLNKIAGKSGQTLEKTLMEKSIQGYEVARSGKTNEDDTGYNTRIHVKPSESVAKADDGKDSSGSKKATSETGSNKQSRGYHLRSTGGKSSHRGTEFVDEEEDQHLARNLSSTDLSNGYHSSQRVKGHQGSPSSNNGNMGGSNEDISTNYGGNSKKTASSGSNKHPSLHSMMCTEEISSFDISTDRDGNGGQLREAELNCTEELDDFKTHRQIEANCDSNASSTRSGSIAKVDRQRKKETKCFNKLCLTDHKIPSLWSKEKINGSAICKTCLEAYKKEQHCQFCVQIYFDDDTLAAADDKDWIECDSCGCWNHIECESAQGLKNIFSLLQKGRNYKYFCPPCRQGKNQKKAKQPVAAQGTISPASPSPTMIVEKPKANKQPSKNEHPRPPLDDWLACEEGLEEPSFVKVKVNENREATVEVSQPKEEEKVQEEDPLKRKLDSLFNKTGKRRTQQVKPAVPAFESFGEVDKLMTQYGGKKLQLSEQEIKSDLNQIRELCNLLENTKDNETVNKMVEVQETSSKMTVEETSEVESVEEKPTSRTKNSRPKQQRRGEKVQERDRSARVIKEERMISTSRKEKEKDREREKEREKDFKDFEPTSQSEVGTTARMSLRLRKVN